MNPTQQHDTSRYRLLLVDDSPEEVRLLIERLRGAGYTLSVALDGERGYQRAISLRPDLILLDVHMPRMDGFALCRRLQATPATASIPIIFLSAAADIESRLSGLQNGARDYVIKPYSAEEVLAKIRLHLSLSPTTQTGDPEAAVSSIDADRALVDAAKRYIDNHLRIDFSLADIANALATHKKRLSLAFHLHENKTVFQYVREARIQTAQRMLAQSNLSVLAIAEELGFSSAANFASAFNRHTGTTPSLYRQRMRHQRTSGSADGAAKDN